MSMFFVFVIAFAVLISVLGYIVTPDKTPFANEQLLEFTTQKPGFKTNVLMLAKNEEQEHITFFKKMLSGKRSPYNIIPYNTYVFKDDLIILHLFSETDTNTTISKSYKIADVAYALNVYDNSYFYNSKTNIVTFKDFSGNIHNKNINELQQHVIKEHLISKRFLLGTDRFGRDVLSQVIIGTRVSLSVGFISVLISLLIGISLGAMAGYYRGWVDNLIVWFINVVWSIPTLLLVIAITFALGKGFWQVFIAVGLTMWVEVARVVRGQVLSLREKEFIEATKALGFSNFRIIFKHILPNVISPVIVISAANFASAILIEAGLSFLGIGVQPPMPSWGTMIKEHYNYIILDKAFLAIIPGIAIMIMVMSFMIIGNALRDALDVKVVNK